MSESGFRLMRIGGSRQYHKKFLVRKLKRIRSLKSEDEIKFTELKHLERNIHNELKKQKRVKRRIRNKKRIHEVKVRVKTQTKKVMDKSWTWIHNAGASFWFLILFLALLVLAFFFNMEELVLNVILDYGYFGIFIITFISELLIQPVGPDIPLIMAIVFTSMNPFWVISAVLLGTWSSLLVAYFVGKRLGAPGIERIIGRRKWAKLEKNESYGKWALFLGAISPVPYIPYLAGLFNLSFKETLKYVILPRSFRFILETIISIFFGNLMEKLFL